MSALDNCYYVHNKGIESKIIFNDEQDYSTFLHFLKSYIDVPTSPTDLKKNFAIKGQTFKGIPHQPKNYFDKIELLAYRLNTRNFHLLVREKERGSLEKFMRSLSTRYAMYFNKKYHRTGKLLEGPYKFTLITNEDHLVDLTRQFHNGSIYSSYKEFLNERETLWIKSEVVLSIFEKIKDQLPQAIQTYRSFVEKHPSNQTNAKQDAILKDASKSLEMNIDRSNPDKGNHKFQKIAQLFYAITIFIFLFSFGLRNILANSKTIDILPSSTPMVSGINTEIIEKPSTPMTSPSPIAKQTLTVKLGDDSAITNIYKEPTTNSEVVGFAVDGENFEFSFVYEGWHEIQLADGTVGYISKEYIDKIQQNKY